MNLLVDRLPEAVEIDGQEYDINADFRACLRTILAFEDDELTDIEKQLVLLQNLYPVIPEDKLKALQQGVKFLNGGEGEREGEIETHLRLYSFEQDAGYIFAAFRQTHGIDLETVQLHWWKFLALFMDLGSETTFCGLVSLRKRIKTGKASKEEIRAYRDMREVIDLKEPDRRTPEEKEKEAEFMRLVEEGMRRREAEKANRSQA